MRYTFEALAHNGPLTRADAIVVLTGDGHTRVPTAVELFRQGAAPLIVVAGGVQEPPYAIDAPHIIGSLIDKGVSPERLRCEDESQHTRESAENVIAMAEAEGWHSLLLVTSAYHLPRALLTFIKVLDERGLTDVYVTGVGAFSPWSQIPEGLDVDRAALVEIEADKVARYQAKGDVASYGAGIDYVRRWEEV